MLTYKYIHRPFVDMREHPTLDSRVASQALFGEEIQWVSQSELWVNIQTPDGYSGWVAEGSYVERSKPYVHDLEITRLKAHVYANDDTEFGPVLSLPYGSKLQVVDSSDSRWVKIRLPDERMAYIQKGDVEFEFFDLASFSKKFLGLPYTWGGRSSFGYDCSGFVQMLYAKMGIQLPRDSRHQVADARARPIALDALKLGDLLFWGRSEKEIGHVGMYLGAEEFIHATARENKPYLRISKLSDYEWSGDGKAYYPYRCARRY